MYQLQFLWKFVIYQHFGYELNSSGVMYSVHLVNGSQLFLINSGLGVFCCMLSSVAAQAKHISEFKGLIQNI